MNESDKIVDNFFWEKMKNTKDLMEVIDTSMNKYDKNKITLEEFWEEIKGITKAYPNKEEAGTFIGNLFESGDMPPLCLSDAETYVNGIV